MARSAASSSTRRALAPTSADILGLRLADEIST
jgi:hypothetical protein